MQREVKREADGDLRNIRYSGCQPWPFPNSLKISLTAEGAGGDITTDQTEIVDARWFSARTSLSFPTRSALLGS